MNTAHIVSIFLAFGGFLLSAYIFHKKRSGETMVCPLKANCDTVIYSDYGKFFYVPLELLGMGYYAFVALSYAAFVVAPTLANPMTVFILSGFTIIAFLFSLYLTFIQAFTLKQWCTWCLCSAGISTLILGIGFGFSEFTLLELLRGNSIFIMFIHLVGAALGVGGATIADIFFFRFLQDLRISKKESDVLHVLSQIIWFALGLLILSGIGLYLPAAAEYDTTPKFLVKMIVVAVIILNGALLNLLISPKLMKISFGERHHHEPQELNRLHRLAFALGSISITSWYFAFFLGSMHELAFSFSSLIVVYLGCLIVAIIFSQLFDRFFSEHPYMH